MYTTRGDRLTYIGKTTFRRQGRVFGIREADRFSHTYLIGRTGTGKSTLLGTMALQDLAAGRGLALLDPHGDLVEEILLRVPPGRQGNVLYLSCPVGRRVREVESSSIGRETHLYPMTPKSGGRVTMPAWGRRREGSLPSDSLAGFW